MIKTMKALLIVCATLCGALATATLPAAARIEIDVNKGTIEPMPIAVTDFLGEGLGKEISDIVTADLQRSGLFAPIDKGAFIEKISNPDAQPRFDDWKVINAQALVTGRVSTEGDGRIRAEYRLWDTFGAEQLAGEQFYANPQNKRRIAHIIADAIYKALTGEEGYFDTRVVFIDESGPAAKRVKRLAIMDSDGANVRYLSNGSSIALTPRFSPNRQEITYMSYESGQPQVYLLQIETGQRELVGNFPGMTFAPRFSPDGQKVIMSLLRDDGNSNIFAMDLRSRTTTRLTDSSSIDTSPSYSPDGSQVVFTSDRGGQPQIYVMGSGGGGQTRISFGGGSYSTPVWSPRGDLIAFTKQVGGEFQIGVMKTDGSGERILSSSFSEEGPTWAPNGRYLMFFAGGNSPKLKTIDLTGRNAQNVPTPNFASDPAWSPLLD